MRSLAPTLFIAALGALACTAPEEPVDVTLGVPFELHVGQTAIVQGTEIKVTFNEVLEDSRCPINALCVWAGNGRIALAVARNVDIQPGPPVYLVELNTLEGPKEREVIGYRIELLGLSPEPLAGVPIPVGKYRAELKVVVVGEQGNGRTGEQVY